MELPKAFQEKMKNLLGNDYDNYLLSFSEKYGQTLRINQLKAKPAEVFRRFICDGDRKKEEGSDFAPVPWCENGFYYKGEERLSMHPAYYGGAYYLQEPSAMAPAAFLPVEPGEKVLDLCAAPGGKSLHLGDKMESYGTVDARDVSQYKVDLIEENIQRLNSINVQARVMDATVFDVESECKADIVIADVPCSGYGVIGKKPEIKYRATPRKQEEIVILQRSILERAAEYVKSKGLLIYSTCTIAKEENEENMMWFMNHFPFKLESMDPQLPKELRSESTALGYLQLLPGVHQTDGFFIAKFRRKT